MFSRFKTATHDEEPRAVKLGDFTITPRVFWMIGLATGIGFVCAYVALALLRLIGLFTNVFFFQRWSFASSSPAGNHLGLLVILVPIVGALIVGFMARYGSERIRGHGIPEAIEAILINGSKVEPKVAVLKPLSSAISIGSGGPFGAEGPIIVTGGAIGSMIAQLFRLSSAERKTLLVAGAAGGMSATFAAPVAAVLLAVELLLFEWKPRSLIPVVFSSATAAATRRYILGPGPVFPTPPHTAFITASSLVSCLVVGLLAGLLSILVTEAVYTAEEGFHKLPIHWMWWPALGGLVIGIGGLIYPQALGVGYDVIGNLLQGNTPAKALLMILIVKAVIWSVSLASGTSGGVLAPLLMLGGALGGLESFFLPHQGLGFWPLVSMGAVLGGTMRAPLTGVIFSLELTHDINMLLPLLIAVTVSHMCTVLVLRRSILTEKVARRGYHLSSEYAVDPLEVLFVREVMRTNVAALPAQATGKELMDSVHADHDRRGQLLYPVVDENKQLVGVITRTNLQKNLKDPSTNGRPLSSLVRKNPVLAYADEPLRLVVYRMVESGFTRFPVVEHKGSHNLVGMVSLYDLLHARTRSLEEERRRERVLRLHLPFGPRRRVTQVTSGGSPRVG
ncbi:MAG TPA: chloride channel protein [Bryobacteraceae bacterium]|nr:chloride channel protein [Bryobacteraceae bacterium]